MSYYLETLILKGSWIYLNGLSVEWVYHGSFLTWLFQFFLYHLFYYVIFRMSFWAKMLTFMYANYLVMWDHFKFNFGTLGVHGPLSLPKANGATCRAHSMSSCLSSISWPTVAIVMIPRSTGLPPRLTVLCLFLYKLLVVVFLFTTTEFWFFYVPSSLLSP